MDDSIKTKKALGQHWLFDISVLENIAELADIQPNDHVVEVGPGLGTLTHVLLESGAEVTAVEFDTELFHKLEKDKSNLFSSLSDNLTVVNQDILGYRFDLEPAGYKVVANIPYYLTSNLIRKLSETPNRPKIAVLLIQKEVAQRLCAMPGDMSLLSVWAQMYFDCTLGPVVPAKMFSPPPKVDSQVVVMQSRQEPVYGTSDKKLLTQVIKAGFSNKRKTLLNSLSAGLHLNKDQVQGVLEASGLGFNARPQELSLSQWITLADTYHKISQ